MTSTEAALRPPTEPWRREATEIAAALGTHPDDGLTSDEAASRLRRHGPNRLESEPPVPGWRKFLGQFADPLVLLLVGAIAVSLAAWLVEGGEGVPFEAVVIGAIIVANAVLGYVQEAKAEQAVEALARMAAPTAGVVRDGQPRRVPVSEVVPGDLLLLAEGDAVAADGRLVEAATLKVAEASLTGESEPVLKDATTLEGEASLGDRLDMVFTGTAVASGRGRAVVTATGMDTEMGNIARLLGRTEREPTPLQREVDEIGRTLGLAVIAIAVVIVGAIALTSDIDGAQDVVDVLLVGVSLAVAAVPEGLPAILSVVLALGVQRMARKQAIVKRLSSVETLGSASVICSDKTGTLTRNEMTVRRVVTASGEVEVTGTGYRPEGDVLLDGHELGGGPGDAAVLEEVRAVLAGGSLSSDAVLQHDEADDGWRAQGDPTEAAFLVAERKLGITAAREARFDRVGEAPFTSERKLMSTLQADAQLDQLAVVSKGAPDVLLARCTHVRVGDEVRPLTDGQRRSALADVDRLASDALRTLAVAYRPVPDSAADGGDVELLEHELVYLGMVGIMDPARPEVAAAIGEAHTAGVRVLLITGDHPRTAARVAADLAIVEPGARAITGSELERMPAGELAEAVREVSVYARVAPEHKLNIVDALQDGGHIVAMTGDGVNDAPSLKAADIGIAMGITGTEVTKEAADMVLADDDFSTIVTAVREGRGIFSNIRKFLRYLLSSNIGEVLTMVIGVIGAGALGLTDAGDTIAVPLLATQILWINLLTDSAPALAMGVDPPPDDVMRRPPRRLTDRIIDRDMVVGIGFVGLIMAVVTLFALDLRLAGGLIESTGDIDEARTMAFTTLVIAQLFNCFNARSDRTSAFHHMFTNPLLWAAIALSLALQVAVVHLGPLNRAFDTQPLGLADWAICAALGSLVLWGDEARKLVARRVGRQHGR